MLKQRKQSADNFNDIIREVPNFIEYLQPISNGYKLRNIVVKFRRFNSLELADEAYNYLKQINSAVSSIPSYVFTYGKFHNFIFYEVFDGTIVDWPDAILTVEQQASLAISALQQSLALLALCTNAGINLPNTITAKNINIMITGVNQYFPVLCGISIKIPGVIFAINFNEVDITGKLSACDLIEIIEPFIQFSPLYGDFLIWKEKVKKLPETLNAYIIMVATLCKIIDMEVF